jgi:hypothetical protein
MPRGLAWIKRETFQGYGCSECDWKYKPAGVLSGGTLAEMKEIYEAERDKEFAAHSCVKHPRPKEPNSSDLG